MDRTPSLLNKLYRLLICLYIIVVLVPLPLSPRASLSTALFKAAHTIAIVMIPTTLHPMISSRANLSISRRLSSSPLQMKALQCLHLTNCPVVNRHHYLTLLLDNKLFLAPLKPDIQKVLDIGTGTGMFLIPGTFYLLSHLIKGRLSD